ncbi:MAG: hypothetical protein ABIE07_01255 [Candidatus Zixiibacteriota bacterium]
MIYRLYVGQKSIVNFLTAIFVILQLASLIPESQAEDLLNNPMDVAFDSTNNRYLVSNYTDGRIIGIDSNNIQSIVLETNGNCKSLDIMGDTLYVAVDSRVAGYILSSRKLFLDVEIETIYGTAGIAADTNGFVYVTAPKGKVFKISVNDGTHKLLSDEGLNLHLHNCAYDISNDRLIVVEHQPHAPIKAVNINDGKVTDLINTEIGEFEGIAIGDKGDIYVASYLNGGSVYRFNTEQPSKSIEVMRDQETPSGLVYNRKDHVIALCRYEANKVVFIPVPVK